MVVTKIVDICDQRIGVVDEVDFTHSEADDDEEGSSSKKKDKKRRKRNQRDEDDVFLDEANRILCDLIRLTGGGEMALPRWNW